MPRHFVLVAGEASGDTLGAGLIRALRQRYPDCVIEGVAGPKMEEAGCKVLCSIDRLSVMGIVEPIKRLPELLRIRRQVKQHVIQSRPDALIGIDAPDFNLGLEKACKRAGVFTVHYVSPTIWAWRKGRIYTIQRAVDLMLVLFPFEVDIYQQHDVPVAFVGHTLADDIPLLPDQAAARETLHLNGHAKILGIFPGSRRMELNHMAEVFIQTAERCIAQYPDFQVITAMVNAQRAEQFSDILKKVAPHLAVHVVIGKARQALLASDVVLLTSGTVSLEALLLKRPMVVAYKMAVLNYWVAKLLVKLKSFALPNLIAGHRIVPEFLQKEVTPTRLADAVLQHLHHPKDAKLLAEYERIHRMLKQDASHTAAQAIAQRL